jgi:hypothetical protein
VEIQVHELAYGYQISYLIFLLWAVAIYFNLTTATVQPREGEWGIEFTP